jgi:hypothetical protein
MPAKNAWAYLVRVWLEPGEDGGVWRASLTDLATRQARYFADYTNLLQYLAGLPELPTAQHPQGEAKDEPKR